jgi:hypothetical protein
MVVQTLDRHPGHTGLVGLHIGALNVQQYFPPHIDLVELELDHLRIVCFLEPSFWLDRPEIHDLRLSSWLESKRSSGKLAANPAPVAMIPSGERTFRLQILVNEESDHSSQQSLANIPAVAYVSQVASPLEALDRRKQDSERKPERRKVARLKSDEFPSLTANPTANH